MYKNQYKKFFQDRKVKFLTPISAESSPKTHPPEKQAGYRNPNSGKPEITALK
jgi:hypothetical protein